MATERLGLIATFSIDGGFELAKEAGRLLDRHLLDSASTLSSQRFLGTRLAPIQADGYRGSVEGVAFLAYD